MLPSYEIRDRFVKESYRHCFDATKGEKVNIDKDGRSMIHKLKCTEPYNIFYNKLEHVPETWKQENAITFKDLLCPSLGKIIKALHISHICNVRWLMKQYNCLENKPQVYVVSKFITFHSNEVPPCPDEADIEKFYKDNPNVHCKILPFEKHFAKLTIIEYENGSLRIIIPGANLCYEDWNYTNNIIWVSPECPKINYCQLFKNVGPTRFKCRLFEYLNSYNLTYTSKFMLAIEFCSFRAVKAHFVSTIPDEHYPSEGTCTLNSVQDTLSRYCVIPEAEEKDWKVVVQTCCVENYDSQDDVVKWLETTTLPSKEDVPPSLFSIPFFTTFEATRYFIYPAKCDVDKSVYARKSGWCLKYYPTDYEKQKTNRVSFYRWKAEECNRTKCMPYFNSYCRVSPCHKKLAYFLLTSKRLMTTTRNKSFCTACHDHDVGVLFMPKFFDQEYFPLAKIDEDTKVFPIMYDLPPTPYSPMDEPWLTEPYHFTYDEPKNK